jgi:hypothetical protein
MVRAIAWPVALVACAVAVRGAIVTVFFEGGELRCTNGNNNGSGAVAFGSYDPWQNRASGFGILEIKTYRGFSDALQMEAAGMVEGCLTTRDIWSMVSNSNATYGHLLSAVAPWFAEQDAFSDAISKDLTPLGRTVGLLQHQLRGLLAGYNAAAPPQQQLAFLDLQLLSATGDFGDVVASLGLPRAGPLVSRLRPAASDANSTHCSALIKVTGDLSDLFIAHSTWYPFPVMLRVYKHYDFSGLADASILGRRLSFSSYPGFLTSLDDYWTVWDTGLAVLETTNDIHNASLWGLIHPRALLSWQRARAANWLAASGADWVRSFSTYPSGTYNNQWMVVDVGSFRPGEPLQPGTLTVLEEMPGLIVSADVTADLSRGYWPVGTLLRVAHEGPRIQCRRER